jgi:GrpB-like predicted nucleotidyltransferase (UPF0157 family)
VPEDRVQHVGSTAVKGLPSKPILDIVLGSDSAEAADRLAVALVGIGYIDRGLGEGSNGRLLVMESAPNVRIAHVHIVQYETQDWKDYVVFRDTLRGDGALRSGYAELKRDLAERFATDRQSYTRGQGGIHPRCHRRRPGRDQFCAPGTADLIDGSRNRYPARKDTDDFHGGASADCTCTRANQPLILLMTVRRSLISPMAPTVNCPGLVGTEQSAHRSRLV